MVDSILLVLIRPGSAFLMILVSWPVYITPPMIHSVFLKNAPLRSNYLAFKDLHHNNIPLLFHLLKWDLDAALVFV